VQVNLHPSKLRRDQPAKWRRIKAEGAQRQQRGQRASRSGRHHRYGKVEDVADLACSWVGARHLMHGATIDLDGGEIAVLLSTWQAWLS
jgi:hypothetical protein